RTRGPRPAWQVVCVSTLALSILQAPATAAQDGEQAAAPSTGASASTAYMIEDIVVTARQREERLQDVPVIVSAFNEDALVTKGAVDLKPLSTAIPSVKLENVGLFQTAASFSMRGIGNTSIESFDDPRVAVYVDGAYQPRTSDGLADMFDVESVEVLRGP